MGEPSRPEREERVLLLPPTLRDAAAAPGVFRGAGIELTVCADLRELCEEIERGAAAAVVPEEAILGDREGCLARVLRSQPAWSDFPLIVLVGSEPSAASTRELELVGHMTLVRRPIEVRSLASTIRAAVRDRRRQYARREEFVERERQAEALRENDRRKDEFLAMLAHELRNPLAAIGNAVRVTRRSDQTENLAWALEVIGRQKDHLARLIDDLMDVSRISRGKIALRREVVEAGSILESASATVGPFAAERGHLMHLELERGSLWVNVDPTRLEQVVVNLLNNAAKYSEDGGRITLSARREGPEVVISVADRGVGIPPGRLPEMFELFAQGDRSLARSEGGLGIGLTVVKRLVELHGGTVSAESAGSGEGSTFTIRLPSAEPPAPTNGEADESVGRSRSREAPGRKILVVDDNTDSARGMARLLRLVGHEVATAYTGPDGIEAARNLHPDAVLLDIGLPGMDGYEVAARLRREPSLPSLLIIAVSGYGQEEDRRRSKQAGFDHHLVKPVDHDALIALLARGR